MSAITKSNEEENITQLALKERKKKQWSLTSLIIGIFSILTFFVIMPFLGTYLLHPSEQFKYVVLVVFLGILLIITLVGFIFGILSLKMGKNALNLSGLIINSFIFLANLGMTVFIIYIQIFQH
jgi:CBS domain containing-hemolysin-like protein